MNQLELSSLNLIGLLFVFVFFGLILVFAALGRRQPQRSLRRIPAFERLGRAVGLAVEAGRRLHFSFGRGGINGIRGASALIGYSLMDRIARAASISDRPPVASSGEGTLALLSQTSLKSAYQKIGEQSRYDPVQGQLTGVTPFSYAAGTLPLIYDQQVSASVLAGHFSTEVALITDANERSGSLTVAGSDNIAGQAVLYATAQEPLIGEELYAAGAYIQAGPMHIASVLVQDLFRWVIVVAILGGVMLKLIGVF